MRYWIVGFFCLSMTVGCGGSDSSTSSELVADDTETVVDEDNSSDADTDESSNDDDSVDVDYSLLGCQDELASVLALINEKRAQAQNCGEDSFEPVAALTWSSLLALAAEEHSANMANYDFFSHTGVDDSTVGTRVTAQGYSWSYIAENIAAGQASVQNVVDTWMSSEGHCRNIMSENVIEMGMACVANSSSTYTRYWTQVFAKPRT